MFSKPLNELTFKDIHDLIHIHKIEEGTHLDFKREPKNLDVFANKLIIVPQ